MFKSSLAVLAAAAASSQAHTIFQRVHVNGVDQGYLFGMRYPTFDGPILDVTSNDIICNGGPNPLVTPFTTDIINIPAGASVAAEWHHGLYPNGYDPTDPADPIDSSHKGPIMVYLAKVDSALTADVTGLKWFKIFEDGLHSDLTTWAVDDLIANKGLVNFKIPDCIPPGNYLMRAEIIALHPASTYPGAQFYMECAQINITGGGSASPATVSFPGAYAGSDPGITVNIYYPPLTSYTIPGPRPFVCPGSGSGTSTAKSSSTAKTSTTSSVKTSSTSSTKASSTSSTKTSSTTKASSTSTSSSGSTGTAAHYAQCGGIGYTGPTVCASPYTCSYLNDYYSQCV